MRWYSYLVGYLIIIIQGKFPEKVINMALVRGIFLWDVMQTHENKIMLKVRISGFRPLLRIAKKCGCHVAVCQKLGMPFKIKQMKKRKILALGSILFFLSLYTLSSFVWAIEIKGTDDLSDYEIKRLAALYGIKQGAVIKKLDLDKIETQLQEAHPKLAWVGISVQGTKVTIEISEKVLIPETDDKNFAHLVAEESGVIEEMLVLIGTPAVKEGDKIKQGDILISGLVYPEIFLNDDGTYSPGGNPQSVRAKGIVRAKVMYKAQQSCPLVERKTVKTGESVQQVIINIGGNFFVVKGPKLPPYQYYEKQTQVKQLNVWRNINLPVELITNVYSQEEKIEENFGHEGAYREAIKRAENDLRLKLPQDAKVLNKSVKVLPSPDPDHVNVEVTWECLDNIAVPFLFQ
ncbi:MAG: sporulation protein YqfD [Bacillota bacterium]